MPAKKRAAPAKKKPIHSKPGFVAHCVPYVRFVFPGEVTPPPPAKSLSALLETIQSRGDIIATERFEGHPEAWAGILAEELIGWLESRAGEGCAQAQAAIVGVAEKASGAFWWSLLQGHENAVMKARRSVQIPGWVSLNPELAAFTQTKLKEIGQGAECPQPMQREAKQKRSRRDVSKGKNRLVDHLWQFITGYRRNLHLKLLEIPHDHPELHERIREMLALPELENSLPTITAWHKVGLKIVMDWTDNAPEIHEAFNRPPLAEIVRPMQGASIAKDLLSAWKSLARETSMIESASENTPQGCNS